MLIYVRSAYPKFKVGSQLRLSRPSLYLIWDTLAHDVVYYNNVHQPRRIMGRAFSKIAENDFKMDDFLGMTVSRALVIRYTRYVGMSRKRRAFHRRLFELVG